MKMVSAELTCKGIFLFRIAMLPVVVLAIFSANVMAQDTGSIAGSVLSASGNPIADAKIAVTNKANGKTSVVRTDANGKFTAPSLPESDFVLRVDARSFISTTATVTIHAGAPTPLEIRMNPEPVGGVIETRRTADLPGNGRDFLQGAELEPGVQNADAGALDPAKNGFMTLSIDDGTGRVSPEVQLDGLTLANQASGMVTENIPLSAVQEFRFGGVLAPTADQLYAPGAVNFITRSGTSELHGDLFGFYRGGDVLSASLPGGNSQDWGRQQYGGNLGGAIIPDKLYFFADVERNKQDLANPILFAGPFSALVPSATTIQEPFREVSTADRLDYTLSSNARAFYRFTYDRSSDVAPFGQGPSLQPFLSKNSSPGNVVGLDLNRGDYVHAFRFEYLKFKNAISQPSSSSGALSSLPTTVDIGGGAVSQCAPGSLYCTGPSPFASQQTQQSNFEFRYDGSRVWHDHIFHFGASFDRIRVGGFNARYSLSPELADQGSVPLPPGILGSTGDATDPANYPVEWAFLGNGQGFASEKSAFGFSGGGFGDNQVDLYAGDTWKLSPNLTVTYGLHWLRDTGRTDSDLAETPALNALGPGLGNQVRQPNLNFAPQAGVAWDTSSSGKTILRAGIGYFYDNSVFGNTALDRPLRLTQGTFVSTPAVCIGGVPGDIQWPNAGSAGASVAGGAGIVNSNGTVSPTWCGESIGLAAPQAAALQQAYQAATEAAAGANASYIGNAGAYAGPYVNGLSLLAPNYQTPRTLQIDAGVQHELWPGMMFTLDYVRDVSTRTLLGVDVNHGGAADTFNVTNAVADRDAAQVANGCLAGTNQVSCMVAKLGPAGALDAYGNAGIGGPGQVTGGAPCSFCAFPGINPNFGVDVMNFPVGRSVYAGEIISLKQQVAGFKRGVEHASFQFSYAHSRYVSQSDDSDLAPQATDFANPDRFTGPAALDRTHQFSVGAHFDLKDSFQLGVISHVMSPLPATLRFQQSSGGAEVLVTDWNGDGTVGDVIPGSSIGSYMRGIKPTGLQNFINNYNSTVAGNPNPQTPAGQQLISGGVFSLQELEQMGGVQQPLASTVTDIAGFSWLKTVDIKLGWQHHFGDRLTIIPSVALFNLFNLANFDLPGNTQSGVLNFGAGSLSPWATSLQPQNTVGGSSRTGTTARLNRASLQSGMSAAGAPRSVEWGLKISF